MSHSSFPNTALVCRAPKFGGGSHQKQPGLGNSSNDALLTKLDNRMLRMLNTHYEFQVLLGMFMKEKSIHDTKISPLPHEIVEPYVSEV